MQDWLEARVQATPDKIALIANPSENRHDSITYKQLNAQVAVMTQRWHNAGIQRGDHVGMVIPPFPLSVAQIFTAMRVGVVFVPINTRLTHQEMIQQLQQADCKWVLPYGDADTLREIRDAGLTIANLDKDGDSNAPDSQDVDLNAPFAIIHTSGTSGMPKETNKYLFAFETV